jgi:hypothetical protein
MPPAAVALSSTHEPAANAALLPPWKPETARLWGSRPLALPHTLHTSPLFSRQALIDLIETYPRSHYALVHMGGQKDRRLWQEGDIGSLKGAQVFEAIAKGRMWLNLRDVSSLDVRYKHALDEMFETLAARMPGFVAPRRGCGILISSPAAQVYYHADLPGQLLCQIEGKKRVYLYPNAKPFLTPENLEDIALFDMELDVPYEPWYDEHAEVVTLEPGAFLAWPLNAPHRVENLDMLNVSMTISYTTEEIRRAQIVNLANGILRHRFGLKRPGRSIAGLPYWSKAVLQKALRGSKWVKSERAARRQVAFTLDPERPGQIRPLLPQAAE